MNHDPSSPRDPRLALIQGALTLPGPLPDQEPVPSGLVQAAVALILRTGPELELLLIRRAEAEGDPWSGQMALPGGRRDPSDPSLLTTAVRETREETGLCLESTGHFLGRLEEVVPATHRLPSLVISPFVFGVEGGAAARAASPEVAEILWVPLSQMTRPDAQGTVEIPLGDDTRTFPCLRIRGRVVWGLTYRILNGFLRTLDPAALGPLAYPPPRP